MPVGESRLDREVRIEVFWGLFGPNKRKVDQKRSRSKKNFKTERKEKSL